MNIVLSSDDNYARHLGQTMVSIMENNTSEEQIVFYILNVGLSEDNINKLQKVSEDYGREIVIVDFSNIESKLKLDNIPVSSFSIEAYSKFFLAEALPESADRAMWIDGDTDVLGSIHDLYYCDMGDCVAAGVVDQPNFGIEYFRKDADIKDGPYFAIGMFVADLQAWRKENMSGKFIDYFVEREGKLDFLEQATINHVLYKRFYKLPLKCHVITPMLFLTYKQMLARWGEPFYTKKE
ncbi:MAG: glycosyltransferase family 8 protein, partial [Clostridia bacterium]|nr:glycosyltransferase family 8 protein [Clostridia bacterium]